MFIRRNTYLALFNWNEFKAREETRAQCQECRNAIQARCWNVLHSRQARPDFATWRDYDQRWIKQSDNMPDHCEAHSSYKEESPYGQGALFALVRHARLTQLGHFMMGSIRVGGKSITVSGEAGSDGLPLDYQSCPAGFRQELVRVPDDVANAYWKGGGWNEVGSGRGALATWALENIKQLRAKGKRT